MEAAWLDREEYPFRPNYFEVNGNRLHYVDEGQGPVLLFVHGTPSWSFDFRKIIKALSKNYRCIAIDHLGFGLSDKPARYPYSTPDHSANLERFVLENDLKDISLVLHDFGGPIALNVALKHPERIKSIVLFNTWMWSSEGDPDYAKLKRILKSPLLPFLYRNLNFSARFVLPSSFGDKKLSGKILKQYTGPFGSRQKREGPLAFARSLLNDQEWFAGLWSQKEKLQDKNILLIWGMKDPVIKPKYLQKFAAGFPHSDVLELAGAGHFPHEEEPEAVIQSMEEFLSRHVQGVQGSR